ncbi:PH domain-containing protein [Marinilactibacillus sp. GCM10026970]|uniref:PH domain-containing protein n=1 Tax=Marinilactibacillus sp. GCM10026970 TaxID=3252642 RepID=UPI0036094269
MNQTNPNVIRYWRIKSFIHCSFFLAVIIVLFLMNQFFKFFTVPDWIFGLTGILITIQWIFFIGIRPSFKAKYWRYSLNEDQLIIYKGLWRREQITIPLLRVQTIESDIGPIANSFDLAEIRVTTAFQTNYLPELKQEEAFEIQERIQTTLS